MTSNIGCLGLIAIAGFIGYLFYRRRRNLNDLQAFFKDGNYVGRDVCPVADAFVYKDVKVGCSDGLIKSGMPFTLLLGSRVRGAGRNAVLDQFIGVYIPPQVKLSDAWLETWKQKVAQRRDGWAELSGVLAVKQKFGWFGPAWELPFRALRVDDGVLIAWNGLHLRRQIEARIAEVVKSLPG